MKRIIAWIVSSVYAVFMNLSPVPPKDIPYVVNSSYTLTNQEEINYKQLYEMYNSPNTKSDEICHKETFDPKKVTELKVALSPDAGYHRYWVQPGVEYTGDPLVCTADEELVAPMDCTTVTLPFSMESQQGTLRVKVGDEFILQFDKLKCWYCCSKKPAPTGGVYTHNGPDYPSVGTTIEKGKVIGIATVDTTLTIYGMVNGAPKEIPYDDFFVGAPAKTP